jgi:hypothetical protein
MSTIITRPTSPLCCACNTNFKQYNEHTVNVVPNSRW